MLFSHTEIKVSRLPCLSIRLLFHFIFHGSLSLSLLVFFRAMSQAIKLQPPAAEDRFQSLTSPCKICGGQIGIERGFSPSSLVVSCQ